MPPRKAAGVRSSDETRPTGTHVILEAAHYLQGEKVVQTFLAAYLSAAGHFALHTEVELGKGYADIVLEPLTARFPQMRHGFVIELK